MYKYIKKVYILGPFWSSKPVVFIIQWSTGDLTSPLTKVKYIQNNDIVNISNHEIIPTASYIATIYQENSTKRIINYARNKSQIWLFWYKNIRRA